MSDNNNSDTKPQHGQATRYPKWEKGSSKIFRGYQTDFLSSDENHANVDWVMCGVPQTHNEVLKSPEAPRWKCEERKKKLIHSKKKKMMHLNWWLYQKAEKQLEKNGFMLLKKMQREGNFMVAQRNSQQWPNQHLRLNILDLPPLFQGTYTRHNYSIVWTTESRVVQQSVGTTRVQSHWLIPEDMVAGIFRQSPQQRLR